MVKQKKTVTIQQYHKSQRSATQTMKAGMKDFRSSISQDYGHMSLKSVVPSKGWNPKEFGRKKYDITFEE